MKRYGICSQGLSHKCFLICYILSLGYISTNYCFIASILFTTSSIDFLDQIIITMACWER